MSRRKINKIQIGNKPLIFGDELHEMKDSTELFESNAFAMMRKILEEDGYLFVRKVIPRKVIEEARNVILSQAAADGSIDNAHDDNDVIKKKSRLGFINLFF